MPKKPEECQLKDCKNLLAEGASTVGYIIDGVTYELRICEFDTRIVQNGGYNITKDRQLKPVPAMFFIKKGTP